MKAWEKRNAEELIEDLVGEDLHGIEDKLDGLDNDDLKNLTDHLVERYSGEENSFAQVLHSLCVLEASERHLGGKKGGARG